MASEQIRQAVVKAVEMAYEAWAVEHPSLAQAIDRISLCERVVESLRQTRQYQQALEAYSRGRDEAQLVSELTQLIEPILGAMLNR